MALEMPSLSDRNGWKAFMKADSAPKGSGHCPEPQIGIPGLLLGVVEQPYRKTTKACGHSKSISLQPSVGSRGRLPEIRRPVPADRQAGGSCNLICQPVGAGSGSCEPFLRQAARAPAKSPIHLFDQPNVSPAAGQGLRDRRQDQKRRAEETSRWRTCETAHELVRNPAAADSMLTW